MCTYICMDIYLHIYNILLSVYICEYVYIYIYVCIHIYAWICICVFIIFYYLSIFVFMCTHYFCKNVHVHYTRPA